MEYVSYQNKVGEEVNVSIGGVAGTKVWLVGKESRLPKHLSVSGFNVRPVSISPNQLGIGFSTGSIYSVDFDFGQFLVSVLEENRKINFSNTPSSKPHKKLERNKHQVYDKPPTGSLVFFRRKSKEQNTVFDFFINDSIKGGVVPNGYEEVLVEISNDPIVICYKNGCEENFEIKLSAGQIKYIECSISEKDNTPKLWEIEPRNGKFFADQAKHFQDKREKDSAKENQE
jgi:hypothetical protein